ncbi:MAG: hypothetical protein WC557_00455 [Ignavibacteriaceae bacterium]
MKIYRTFLFLLFAVLLSSSLSAQQVITNFDLTIFKPLPEVDLAALWVSKDFSGVTRVFQISIQPPNVDVILEGEITWTDLGKTSSQWLYNFKTKPFKSTTFYNTDLGGSTIKIGPDNTNNNVINDLVTRYGKPVGRFDFNLTLKDLQGNVIRTATDFVEFVNPTQSFTILTPTVNSELQQGNIVVSWIQIPGADHYKIKVNTRANSYQSPETALLSGNPLIDFDQIPNSVSSIKLNEIPNKRPILEGQELVLQIVAVISLPSGNKELFSDIINFRIAGLYDAETNAIKNDLMALTSLPGFSTFANVFSDTNLIIKRLVDEKGNPISRDQLRNLLNYLNAHPDRVISAQFIYNNNQ